MDPVFWSAKSSPTGVGVELAPIGEDAIGRSSQHGRGRSFFQRHGPPNVRDGSGAPGAASLCYRSGYGIRSPVKAFPACHEQKKATMPCFVSASMKPFESDFRGISRRGAEAAPRALSCPKDRRCFRLGRLHGRASVSVHCAFPVGRVRFLMPIPRRTKRCPISRPPECQCFDGPQND